MVFREAEVIRKLAGHSGCTVLLCRTGDEYFVRKISAGETYNLRLRKQIDKQTRLSTLIRTPLVLDRGERDGLLFFDMEYINGQDFRTHATLSNISGICEIVHKILDPIATLHATQTDVLEARRFRTKIKSVREGVDRNAFSEPHRAFLDALFDTTFCADWSDIPQSECHGDLTLENILVRNDGSIVFIDVLDGDLESAWLDVAKLLQDLDSGWSLRTSLWKTELSSADRLMSMLSRYLYEEIDAQAKTLFPQLQSKLMQLRALQALRVLPYVHDEATFARVVQGLRNLDR